MMMYKSSDKDILRHDDFVEDGAIRDYLGVELKNLVSYLPTVEKAITTMATKINTDLKNISFEGLDLSGLKKINENTKAANDLALLRVKYLKLEADANRALSLQRKAEIAEKKAAVDLDKKINTETDRKAKLKQKEQSAYNKLNKELTENRRISKDLLALQAQGIALTAEQSRELERATKRTQELDTQIKAIDDSLGLHQRHVGDYKGQLSQLSQGVKAFSGLGSLLSKVLGIDTEVFTSMKEAGRALKDIKEVIETTTIAKEADTKVTKAGTLATAASTGGILLLVGAVIAAGFAVYEYVKHLNDQKEKEEALLKIEEKRRDILKETSGLQRETAIANRDNLIEELVLRGKISEAEAERMKIRSDLRISQADDTSSEIQSLKKLGEAYGVFVDDLGNYAKSKEIFDPVRGTRDTIAEEKYLKDVAEFERLSLAIRIQFDEKRKAQKAKSEAEVKKVDIEAAAEEKKRLEERLEELRKLREKLIKEITDIYKKIDDNTRKFLEDGAKESLKRHNDKIDELQDKELRKRKEQTDKLLGQLKYKEFKLKEHNDEVKKSLDELTKFEDQVTEGIAEGYATRARLQDAATQKDIDQRKRLIDIQAKLAAEGKDNTLAEQQAAAIRLEEKRLQDQKRAARIQENITLIETFSDTLQSALKSDKPFFKAFGEAAGATGIVKAMFAKLISGSAYEGTEDTGGAGNIDGKGGKLFVVHPNERIMTKEQNQLLGGISNDELVRSHLDYKQIFDAANVTTTIVPAKSESKLATVFTLKIDELKQEIRSKPETSVSLDRLGEWTREIKENNLRTVIHHKQSRRSLRERG